MIAGRRVGADFGSWRLVRGFTADARSRSAVVDLLDRTLNGRIRFICDDATVWAGQQSGTAPDVAVLVHRPRLFRRMLAWGNLGLAEAYMDRDFDIDHGTLAQLLTLLAASRVDERVRRSPALVARALAMRAWDTLRGTAACVRRHYDQGDDLFESFLDSSLTYSCGYAESPDDDIEQLQRNKFDRICRKLRLRDGDSILDIGCGYGGLLLYAASRYDIVGLGVTNSVHHARRAAASIRDRGLASRIEIQCADYRRVTGRFDKIVSVGMMEHVPRRDYRRYVGGIAGLLRDSGIGLIHTIGCNGPRNTHDPFVQAYIFPGSNQPRLSEIAAHLERSRLFIIDVENMVRHYALTMQRWLERFSANRDRLDGAKYDEGFVRMWEYYLACGVAGASATDGALYQVVFMKDRAGPIPLRRV